MNKLSRRDFLKRIGVLPFMAIPLIGDLDTEEEVGVARSDGTVADFDYFTAKVHGGITGWESAKLDETDPDPEIVEIFAENKYWDVARLDKTDSSRIGYSTENSDGAGWTFADIPDSRKRG